MDEAAVNRAITAFGDNLKRIRTDKGISQEELAFKAGIAHSSIVRIEKGQINTKVSTIVRLAEALEVRKSVLLDY